VVLKILFFGGGATVGLGGAERPRRATTAAARPRMQLVQRRWSERDGSERPNQHRLSTLALNTRIMRVGASKVTRRKRTSRSAMR